MVGTATALLATVLLASGTPLISVGAGNALTLPAQRHGVRIDLGAGREPVWLLALQQAGVERRGLSLFRSDNGARNFRYIASIQPDTSHHDRAELLAVGRDVAVVYSYESSSLGPSSRHDVYFQWWRYQSSSDTWTPEPAVRVFDSPNDKIAYSRALLARDSQGRLWIQAFRLEQNGRSTAVLSVSTNNGASFQAQADLDQVRRRGGGRLLSVGNKLVFVYGMHDGFEPARMRIRKDSDPVDHWEPVREAFPEGIYHGAALSAVADGQGGMHFVYKDETERLYYRRFDGNAFGSRTLLEDSRDWAMQPATTRVGNTLYVFYNRFKSSSSTYELHARVLQNGTFSQPVVLDSQKTFKGYLNAVDVLPVGSTEVPCFFGNAPDASSQGTVSRVAMAAQGGEEAPPPPPDEDEPPPPGALLFSDDFTTPVTRGLGAAWTVKGLWYAKNGRAISDLDGEDVALAGPSTCANCRVEALVQHFADEEAGVVLRAQGNARYTLLFLKNGRVQVRREVGSSVKVLGEASGGVSSSWDAATLSFSARGAGPVELVVSVNGQVRLTVVDSSSSALKGAGTAGLITPIAGVWFDSFRVHALEPDTVQP
jgi:hypothetical protein